MVDVYEQNLASKSTLTTTDYIRVVGSDNVSYKQLVSDVAKKIIENYTGSTLAGSAQSVKSALDSLNSKTSYTTVFDVTMGNNTYFYADRVGRTIFLEMVLRPTSAVSANTQLAHIDGLTGISKTHWSTVTDTGEPVRLVINTNGTLTTESAISANKWVSASCTALWNG